MQPAMIAAWIAHVLAWLAMLALLVVPVYEGTAGRHTIIEVNGAGVVPVLLTPVVLSGIALLIAWRMTTRPVAVKVGLLVAAALLLAFCVLGVMSIGFFYAPAAVALCVATLLRSSPRLAPQV